MVAEYVPGILASAIDVMDFGVAALVGQRREQDVFEVDGELWQRRQ